MTEVSLHGINTFRKAKSVTHVSGTSCHLSLRSDIASDLAQWAGNRREIHDTPFRCTTCDSRTFKITCEEIHHERSHEVVVWKPVKVKF